jgi:hypothetical protein
MTLYRWQSGPVAQIECSASATGKSVHAIVRTREGTSLAAIQQGLSQKHIQSFIRIEDNQDILVIPQIKTENQLVETVTAQGWVKGNPQAIVTRADKESAQKRHSQSLLQKDPMFVTTVALLIASSAWIGSAIMRAKHNHSGKFKKEDWSEMMVGVINLAGNIPLLLYGGEKEKDPMLAFHEELTKHLKEDGITLPTGKDATAESAEKSGYLHAADNFMKKNVISILSSTKAAASALVAYSATKKETFNTSKLVGGSLYSAAWWATFVLDKPHAPPYRFKSKDGGSSNHSFGHWLAENPRARITAPVGVAMNVVKLYGAGNEGYKAHLAVKAAQNNPAQLKFTQAKRYDFIWNVISYSAVTIANYTFGRTGKKESSQKKDPQGFERDLLMVSSNLLTQLPDAPRRAAITSAAEYVTSIQGIKHSQAEVEKMLADQIEHLRTLPPALQAQKAF